MAVISSSVAEPDLSSITETRYCMALSCRLTDVCTTNDATPSRQNRRGAIVVPKGLAVVPTRCHSGAMDLTTYVSNLGREFATLAEAGGEESRALIERLTGSLESAIRMTLLDA